MKVKKYVFPVHTDERGRLVAVEEFKDIPFDIKRVYYIFDTTDDVTRGQHAHKDLEQILICLNGSCKVLLDNGEEKETVILEKPEEGLYIPNNMWREIYNFKPGTILLVLASRPYDSDDYIRTYEDFLNLLKGN